MWVLACLFFREISHARGRFRCVKTQIRLTIENLGTFVVTHLKKYFDRNASIAIYLSRIDIRIDRLPRNLFFKISLRFLQQLLATIRNLSESRHQIPSLQSHMKLKVSHVFANIFTQRTSRMLRVHTSIFRVVFTVSFVKPNGYKSYHSPNVNFSLCNEA